MIANEEEAAIGSSGKVSLNGLLPSPGPLTRIAEGDDRRRGVRVAGGALRGEGFAGAPLIRLAALGECAGWEFAGGDAFRAISAVEPLRSGLASGLADGLSEPDPGVAGAGAFTVGVRKLLAAGGV